MPAAFAASERLLRSYVRVARRLQLQRSEEHVKHGVRLIFAIAGTLVAVGACSSASKELASGYGPGADHGSNGGGAGTAPLPPGQSSGDPEQEVEPAFRVPVVSGHWVWTANPTSGRVALIDASNFSVKTALAGAAPTYLTALPAPEGGSRALVINSASEDATLLSAASDGEIEAIATMPVHAGANAWAVTADGRFAIAWTDASAIKDADPSQGFQDITVLDLAADPPSSKRLSVGYRPARVFVDDDDTHAYLATDAGIDVVDLTSSDGPVVEREVEISARPATDSARRDVNVTPNGDYAFVRREGQSFVTVVDIARGQFKDVQLPGVVTDLDLTADAKLAVAVVRDPVTPQGDESPSDGGAAGAGGATAEAGAGGLAGEGGAAPAPTSPEPQPTRGSLAVLLPVAEIFDQPTLFDSVKLDEVFGSVELGARAATALLFTNAVPSTRLTLLGLADASHRTLDLKLPVFTAASSPDGAHAIALLQPPSGSEQPGAFAVVPVAKNLPSKIQGTAARTVPVELSKDQPAMLAVGDQRALVTVSNGSDVNVSYLISMPELTVDVFALDSVPLPHASGLVLEANQAFVAQQHPEGRITFIDLASKEQHTLTGFELSTKVGK